MGGPGMGSGGRQRPELDESPGSIVSWGRRPGGAGLICSAVAEVDLNVVCKNCGSEVSPYITECPYCGQRLRKRAPKLRQEGEGVELAPPKRRRRLRLSRRPRTGEGRPLSWLSAQRPYVTIALVLAGAALLLVERSSDLGLYDLGAVIGPLDGDWWRLVAAQFVYENVGYLFVVAVAVAIFGSSFERRYGPLVTLVVFLGCGAAGMYVASEAVELPVAVGGNASALGLLCAWLVRDFRDRRAGNDTESDLFGVVAIAAVLALMPVLEPTADAWAGLTGAVVGCVAGLLLPQRD
jgi:membrane associated rhomboid family serine protease